ncbi:MAG: hypothetical protein KME42_18435 [Tildeniella nuda ZEHNDER 1965/U140]|jgi:hypothetical protein|nr:hypothetical protein [Tildeniella nuda ZEHNDER 1965/U140]
MKKRLDDFNPRYSKIDQSLVQIETRLDIQIRPIAQWFTQIDRLCNEVDATVSDILGSDKERMNRTLCQPFSTLRQPLPSNKHSYSSLDSTLKQLQDLAVETQKEVYKLKSQLQKETPIIGSK